MEEVFLELQTTIIKNIHKQSGTTIPNITSKTDVINAFDDMSASTLDKPCFIKIEDINFLSLDDFII